MGNINCVSKKPSEQPTEIANKMDVVIHELNEMKKEIFNLKLQMLFELPNCDIDIDDFLGTLEFDSDSQN